MALDFTAIDFETANSSNASACSVGLVKVRDGRVVDRAGWLIKPPAGHDAFVEWNVRIHGIMAADVVDAALWAEQLPDLLDFAGGDLMVAHNAGFDMGVIKAACAATFQPIPAIGYVCSLQVARQTYTLDSYRLPSVARAAGFDDFAHHDALADSEACAAIMIDAAERYGVGDLPGLAAAAGVRVSSTVPVAAPATPPASRAAASAPRSTVLAPPPLGPGGWAPPPLAY
jgi:DNA polymerase III subunit epsilon